MQYSKNIFSVTVTYMKKIYVTTSGGKIRHELIQKFKFVKFLSISRTFDIVKNYYLYESLRWFQLSHIINVMHLQPSVSISIINYCYYFTAI